MFLKIKKINKHYSNTKVLNNVSFSIKKGEVISVVGPSGSGKSTILKSISGFCEIDSGTILLNSKSISEIEPSKRNIAYVFQDSPLFPHLSVIENILFNLKVFDHKKLNFLLKKIKIDHLKNRYPHEISGGENQRVAVVRSLIRNPELLLLDEPFSNLDLSIKEHLKELVFSIIKELKTTTIIVNHDIQDSLEVSDRILILLNGEIKSFDTPHSIYTKPKCLTSGRLFGLMNRINYDGDEFYCRPEHMNCTSSGLQLNVLNSKFTGPHYKITAQLNSEKIIFYDNKKYEKNEKIYINVAQKNKIYFY